MTFAARLSALAALGSIAVAAPAAAQNYGYIEDVAFFERVAVGNVEITPFGIKRDTRCADLRFCTRENRFTVSVILHDYRGMTEVVLDLDRPAVVPGGYLVLRDAGTRPKFRGVIPLREYALAIEYIPFDEAVIR